MVSVVNKYKEPFTVYIGRGSIWGNPYSHKDGTKAIHKVDTVEDAINNYKSYLWKEIKEGRITKLDLIALEHEVLGCYCKPKPCHGDVLVKAVEWALVDIGYKCVCGTDLRLPPYICRCSKEEKL